jgi:hypothetical protein
MDIPSPSGPGIHINAHGQGVFRAHAVGVHLTMGKTVGDIKVTSKRVSDPVGATSFSMVIVAT